MEKKLKDYPKEIQECVLKYHRSKKSNPYDVKDREDALNIMPVGLFVFGDTKEGHVFWAEIFINDNINNFYTLYPKQKDILEDFAKFNPNL